MNANPILLQKKYSRVIERFAKQQGISLDAALDFFYHSEVYQLIRDGVSDMHCMSERIMPMAFLALILPERRRSDVKRDKKKRNIHKDVPLLVFMAARDKGQQKL